MNSDQIIVFVNFNVYRIVINNQPSIILGFPTLLLYQCMLKRTQDFGLGEVCGIQ